MKDAPVLFTGKTSVPGWIAHWREGNEGTRRLARPRQLYQGPVETSFIPLDLRHGEEN